MTITYPLTFPSVGIISSSFRLVRAVSQSFSPFTFAQQNYKHPGERWEGEVTFKPVRRADAAEIQAFMGELYGAYGTFLYSDPDFLVQGLRGSGGGTPLVKGGSQTGNTLLIDGLPSATSNVYKKGDYFQLGSGTSARLYMITQNINSNTAGEAILQFVPALRSSPADNAALTFTSAKGLFRAAENIAQWDSNAAMIYGFTFAFKEAVGE